MELGRFIVIGISLVGAGVASAGTAATTRPNQNHGLALENQTVMSTNVGDRDDSGQMAGQVEDSRAPGADGSLSQSLKKERSGQAATLDLNPDQRQVLTPHAIMVHTELQSAKNELNGIRTQLKALPAGAAPNSEELEHLSIYGKNVNQDLKVASAHEAELKGSAKSLPGVGTNDSFVRMDSSVQTALTANRAWQTKTASASYWHDPNRVSNDLEQLTRQIDQALDENRSFGSSALDVSYTS